MSTYWDVYCVTCKEELGLHGNHQEAPANAIAADAAKLALVPDLVVDAHDTYDFYGESMGNKFNTNFFVKHAGHEIRARNEYGNLSGRCGAYVACEACGTMGSCDLGPGHEGKCTPIRHRVGS